MKEQNSQIIRIVWSIIGLIVSGVMINPVINSFADLHGHTTRAAIYLVIFLVGLVVSWVSVSSPIAN